MVPPSRFWHSPCLFTAHTGMTKAWTMSTVVRLSTGTTTMTFTCWKLLFWTTHVESEKYVSWSCLGRFLLDITIPDMLRKNIDDPKNHCQVHQHLHFHHNFLRSHHQYLASPTTIADSTSLGDAMDLSNYHWSQKVKQMLYYLRNETNPMVISKRAENRWG